MNKNLLASPVLVEAHIILDSKINNIEYQALCTLEDCVCSRSVVSVPTTNRAKTLTDNFEKMLEQISFRNKELKQLQIMKCWLRKENLSKVMGLLRDDSYLSYSEETLENLLRKGTLQLMRSRQLN